MWDGNLFLYKNTTFRLTTRSFNFIRAKTEVRCWTWSWPVRSTSHPRNVFLLSICVHLLPFPLELIHFPGSDNPEKTKYVWQFAFLLLQCDKDVALEENAVGDA
jgi:hypothetical protein